MKEHCDLGGTALYEGEVRWRSALLRQAEGCLGPRPLVRTKRVLRAAPGRERESQCLYLTTRAARVFFSFFLSKRRAQDQPTCTRLASCTLLLLLLSWATSNWSRCCDMVPRRLNKSSQVAKLTFTGLTKKVAGVRHSQKFGTWRLAWQQMAQKGATSKATRTLPPPR